MFQSGVFKTAKLATIAGIAVIGASLSSSAAEVTFLSANNLQQAMLELLPRFEKSNGHKVNVSYASVGTNTEKVRNGEPADLAIVSSQQWKSLNSEGKLAPGAPVAISKIGIGVFGKKGAPKPDIKSVEGFKKLLLETPSIALGDPKAGAPVSVYLLPLFERLGVSEEVRPKIRFTDAPGPFAITDVVKNGGADIGFTQVTNILASPGVDLIGPLPAEIQNYTTFTGAIPKTAKHVEAANELLTFLKSSAAVTVLKAKGFDVD